MHAHTRTHAHTRAHTHIRMHTHTDKMHTSKMLARTKTAQGHEGTRANTLGRGWAGGNGGEGTRTRWHDGENKNNKIQITGTAHTRANTFRECRACRARDSVLNVFALKQGTRERGRGHEGKYIGARTRGQIHWGERGQEGMRARAPGHECENKNNKIQTICTRANNL